MDAFTANYIHKVSKNRKETIIVNMPLGVAVNKGDTTRIIETSQGGDYIYVGMASHHNVTNLQTRH